jgi:hypothetical protein
VETVVKPMPDEQRRRARRSAIVLLLVAAAIYAGFIVLSVTGHRT